MWRFSKFVDSHEHVTTPRILVEFGNWVGHVSGVVKGGLMKCRLTAVVIAGAGGYLLPGLTDATPITLKKLPAQR